MGDTAGASPRDAVTPAALDLRDLRVFVEVAETGSFRQAASRLFLSQPSVSRAVARLEGELGSTLLQRGPGGARVTEPGQVLLDGARRLLAAAGALRVDVTELGRSAIRIGATATSTRTILAPYLSRWMAAHPEISVTGVEDSEGDLVARLTMGDCDAAVVSTPLDLKTLEGWRVARVRVMAVLPPGHRLADEDAPLPVAELAQEPLLLNGRKFPATQLLVAELGRIGVDPQVVFESGVGQTLASMVEAGLGVAVFGDAADLRGFDLATRPVLGVDDQPLTYDLYLAWLRSAVAPWMRDFALGVADDVRRRSPRSSLTAPGPASGQPVG